MSLAASQQWCLSCIRANHGLTCFRLGNWGQSSQFCHVATSLPRLFAICQAEPPEQLAGHATHVTVKWLRLCWPGVAIGTATCIQSQTSRSLMQASTWQQWGRSNSVMLHVIAVEGSVRSTAPWCAAILGTAGQADGQSSFTPACCLRCHC